MHFIVTKLWSLSTLFCNLHFSWTTYGEYLPMLCLPQNHLIQHVIRTNFKHSEKYKDGALYCSGAFHLIPQWVTPVLIFLCLRVIPGTASGTSNLCAAGRGGCRAHSCRQKRPSGNTGPLFKWHWGRQEGQLRKNWFMDQWPPVNALLTIVLQSLSLRSVSLS